MPKDPYKDNLFKASPYASKTPVIGSLVCILDAELPERGLELSPFPRAPSSNMRFTNSSSPMKCKQHRVIGQSHCLPGFL